MSDQLLLQLKNEQQYMTRMATRLVLGLSLVIHILLNVYARMVDDDFLKMEVPVMSAVTIVAIIVSFRIFKKH